MNKPFSFIYIRHSQKGVTLVELVLAVSIMVVIFAAVVPIFTGIRASWDIKQVNAEMVQNGRVLMDHMYNALAQAQGVTGVSDPAEEDGYIQFEDKDDIVRRYQIGSNGYVEYGTPGDMYVLAGPVSKLQFVCYDGYVNPTVNVNDIRLVHMVAVIYNSDSLGYARTWTTSIHIRRD